MDSSAANEGVRFGHQGDVWFIPLDGPPDDLASCKEVEPVLAYGEVTGHSHRFADFAAGRVRCFRNDTHLYFHIEGDAAALVHEEHGVPRIAPGWGMVNIQKERSLEDVGWKAVVD